MVMGSKCGECEIACENRTWKFAFMGIRFVKNGLPDKTMIVTTSDGIAPQEATQMACQRLRDYMNNMD